MRKRPVLSAAAYVALAVADTMLVARPGRAARAARFVTKPLLMPALATSFATATEGRGGTVAKGAVAAQAFSWIGDVALLGRGDRAFLAGLGSFFAGHVGYIAAFAGARDKDLPLRNPGTKAAAGLLLTAGPVMAAAAARTDGRMGAPVAAYTGVLATMFGTSTMLDRRLPARARRTVVAGTGLFLVSDTILGVRQFLLRRDSRALEVAVMATYTAGQGLIAAGLAQACDASEPRPPKTSTYDEGPA
jgi:uncharacterized membrane protein YhhN